MKTSMKVGIHIILNVALLYGVSYLAVEVLPLGWQSEWYGFPTTVSFAVALSAAVATSLSHLT